MIQQRFSCLTSRLGFIVFAIGIALATSESCDAQLLRDLNRVEVQQYAPNDPQMQGRLFNLQTGHAGTFYNCDGEESAKRNSPYICWKQVQHVPWYGTFRDVVNFRQDRNEIVQRICDGAGKCCSGDQQCQSCQSSPVAQQSVPSCGCASCLAAKKATSQRPVRVSERAGLLSDEPSKASDVTPATSLLDRFRVTKPSLR